MIVWWGTGEREIIFELQPAGESQSERQIWAVGAGQLQKGSQPIATRASVLTAAPVVLSH